MNLVADRWAAKSTRVACFRRREFLARLQGIQRNEIVETANETKTDGWRQADVIRWHGPWSLVRSAYLFRTGEHSRFRFERFLIEAETQRSVVDERSIATAAAAAADDDGNDDLTRRWYFRESKSTMQMRATTIPSSAFTRQPAYPRSLDRSRETLA